jgi:SET domain-containing protein
VVLLPDDLALEKRMGFTHSDSIEVKRVKGKGRGVFARCLIRKGELIEAVPMLVLTAKEFEDGIAGTSLANYCFAWNSGTVALALGYGSIYNHSYRPNARYEDVWPQTKEFTALRDIEPGEEITVNYNGQPRSRAKVWFEVVEATRTRTNGSSNGAH